MLAHSSAVADVVAAADQQAGSSWHNGNDAVALLYGGTFVDVIGEIGVDAGTQWGSGDLATANRTLRRQPGGTQTATTLLIRPRNGFGLPQDTFDGMGTHSTETVPCTENCGGGGSSQEPSLCGDSATRIHTIQGAGFSSPLVGTVHTIEAVVVEDFQASERLNGFFLQERDSHQNQDPFTSEGLFVFDSANFVNPKPWRFGARDWDSP